MKITDINIYSFTENLTINNNYQMKSAICHILLITSLIFLAFGHQCQHHLMQKNTTKHFLNDLTDGRLLQGTETGKIRIFVDYTQLTSGGDTQINTIKRIMNISASYFYNVLNVTRLPRLYFPKNVSQTCNSLTVPDRYVANGTIGDLGIICGNQINQNVVYIAKSTPCAFLESTKRPIWGMILFNNVYLKFDQEGFQQILYVGMHELTHVLGFSASMYSMFPKGNLLVNDSNGAYYLTSPKIQAQIKSYFNCSSALGLPLQDQDGTLIASHWEKKVVGNQFMISSNKKNSFMSRFTLALFESTGFYSAVNYTTAEPSVWGKGKGCEFLNVDNCAFDQFCTNTSTFMCDSDSTGIGKCGVDPYTGSCMVVKYYTNTICVDENYELKNLNAQLNSLERGGSSSRCFDSDLRQVGLNKNSLNNRCYISVCSQTNQFLYILVGSYVLVCRNQGLVIAAPPGLNGTITCPSSFARYCSSKKTCPYHCNKNGACVNGQCLCTGITSISASCVDISIFQAPIGTTGGLLNAFTDQTGVLTNLSNANVVNNTLIERKEIKSYSINSKCIQGSAFDELFGQCLKCSQVFNCVNCNDEGCISCDNGKAPVNKRC